MQSTTTDSQEPTDVPGQELAIVAESLYLLNLLLLPGIAFLLLVWIYHKNQQSAPLLAKVHLRQTVFVSIWAGLLLIVVSLGIFLISDYQATATWVIIILYFTTCHATLVMFGILGLAKAMTGKTFHYPLFNIKD